MSASIAIVHDEPAPIRQFRREARQGTKCDSPSRVDFDRLKVQLLPAAD